MCLPAFVAVVLVVSGAAVADVDTSIINDAPPARTFDTSSLEHQSSTPTGNATDTAEFDPPSQPRVEFTDVWSLTAFGRSPAANYHQSPEAQIPTPATQAVRQLPAGPGGATLFLFGVGCLGAVKIGKSARGFHSMPEWFHTGGPIQIGHVSVLDLDAQVLLAPYHDESPSDGSASFSHPPQPLPRLDAQCFLTAVDVRGPPLVHI